MGRLVLLLSALAFLHAAHAEDGFSILPDSDALPLSEVIGIEVRTAEGGLVGKITDLTVDPESGTVEGISVGGERYPIGALLAGDKPRQVVLEPVGDASAGASSLLPRLRPRTAYAIRDFGSADRLVVDLRTGRLRRRPEGD